MEVLGTLPPRIMSLHITIVIMHIVSFLVNELVLRVLETVALLYRRKVLQKFTALLHYTLTNCTVLLFTDVHQCKLILTTYK